jgi:hypothetical protein
VAAVHENYPEGQLSKDNFADIQRAIGRLVDEIPEEKFVPRPVDSYWAKEAAILVCHDWLAARVPTLGMLEYEEMRSQGRGAPAWVSWDLSRPLESLDETYNTSSIIGWLTSTGQDGEVLAIPRGRLGN